MPVAAPAMPRRSLAREALALCLLMLIACLAPEFARGLAPGLAPAQKSAATQSAGSPRQAGASAYTLPPEKLAKAVALNRIRNILDIAGGLWSIATLSMILWLRIAAGLEAWTQRIAKQRWLQGLLFFAILLVLIGLGGLPIDIYAHSVSRAYGISVQGWAGWLGDQAKSLGVTVVLAAPVLLLFNWIVRRWPRRYWLGAWAVTVPLMVLSLYIAPLFEPLFNTYEPLAKNHAALVEKLETVVARTGTSIPPDRMFLMKASEKTNGLNAYVDGIGPTKRIVVWDTTAGRIPDDQILFIFAHESGHYVLNHIPKMLAAGGVGIFFLYWLCAAAAERLAGRFGAGWGLTAYEDGNRPGNLPGSRAGFVVLMLAITIAGFLFEPVGNAASRHIEHEADVYGQEAIHTLVPDPQQTAVAGFQSLGEAWLEDPDPSPIVEFWEYNHPSVKNRANFAAHYNPWANGGHGQFFDR
jgi:STE24 endopeptidase